jgi:hypothetical protein
VNKLLVRHGYGDAKELLDLTRAHHEAWASTFGWNLLEDNQKLLADHLIHWEKWRLMNTVIQGAQTGDLIAYLDADTVVVGDLSDVLPEGKDVGVTRWGGNHYSAGAIYWRVSDAVKAHVASFVSRLGEEKFMAISELKAFKGRSYNYYSDELAFDFNIRKSALQLEILGRKWNGRTYAEDIRVVGYHGERHPVTLTLMADLLKEIENVSGGTE